MKSRVITIICVFVLLLSVPPIHAKEDGIVNKSVVGCTCHNGGEDGAQLTINLPEKYTAGQSYSLEISVTNENSMDTSGGFNLKATNGIFSTTDPNAKIDSNEAVHSNPNSRTWNVDWLAPISGSGIVTFTLAALAADGNDGKSGDDWGTLSIDVSEENLPPSVSSVTISPTNPTSSDSLELSYTYLDVNNDLEDGTTIIWKVNGVINSKYNNLLFIDFKETTRGDIWGVEVTPSDGENEGELVSQQISIINSKPVASNLSISPAGPSQFNDLTANWDEYDEDNDLISSSLKWYKNNTHQTELDGLSTVNSSFTKENEEWFFSITLNDSFEENIENSSKVILNLINDIPTIENIFIENIKPTTNSNLSATWLFLDGDGDEQVDFEIKWYRNCEYLSQLDNKQNIGPEFTFEHQVWYFEIRATDGLEYSEWYTSSNKLINNSMPEVFASIIPENPTNNSNLELNLTTIDADYDRLLITVEWYKNDNLEFTTRSIYHDLEGKPEFVGYFCGDGSGGLPVEADVNCCWNDIHEIKSNQTKIGEKWHALIFVHEGSPTSSLYTVFKTEEVTIFPESINKNGEVIENFTTIAYVQSITYGILTMVTFMLLQFLLSVKASKEEK